MSERQYFIWKAEGYECSVELRPHTFWWILAYSVRQGVLSVLLWSFKPLFRLCESLSRIKECELVRDTLFDSELQAERKVPLVVGAGYLEMMRKKGKIVNVRPLVLSG
jgi:hypothetical protein